MRTTIKLHGLKGIEDELLKIKGSTAKSKVRKVLKQSGEPVARKMRSLAPIDERDLVESIDVSTVLTRSQRRQQRKGSFADVEMHIGAGGLPQAHLKEFGTYKEAAQPFARPAWESLKIKTLDMIGALLWASISRRR